MTFVAQYTGAGRPERVGPAVWQALYFAVVAGVAFIALWPLAPHMAALGGHSPPIHGLGVVYFRCPWFAALPALIVGAANSFFARRGRSSARFLLDPVRLTPNPPLPS